MIACTLLPVSPLIPCFLNSDLHDANISSLMALVIRDIILTCYSCNEFNILSLFYRLINDLWHEKLLYFSGLRQIYLWYKKQKNYGYKSTIVTIVNPGLIDKEKGIRRDEVIVTKGLDKNGGYFTLKFLGSLAQSDNACMALQEHNIDLPIYLFVYICL